jgi:hypothetical protein
LKDAKKYCSVSRKTRSSTPITIRSEINKMLFVLFELFCKRGKSPGRVRDLGLLLSRRLSLGRSLERSASQRFFCCFGCSIGCVCVVKSNIPKTKGGGELPEDVGRESALLLMEQLLLGGCVDSTSQPLILMFMSLCPEDVSRLRVGSELSEAAVETLRLAKLFVGVVFKIERQQQDDTIMLSCVGSGLENIHKIVR